MRRTDRHGRAVVGKLLAYLGNRIRFDLLTLPSDASVGAVVKIVVPRSQGGVRVDFEEHRVRSAILKIVQADGSLLPPMTPVQVAGVAGAFVAGNVARFRSSYPASKVIASSRCQRVAQ